MFEQRKTIKKTRDKKINSVRVVLFGQLREEIIEKKSVKNIHVKKKKWNKFNSSMETGIFKNDITRSDDLITMKPFST